MTKSSQLEIPPGVLGLSEDEKESIFQFRQYLGDACQSEDDWTLFKWLKFHSFDVLKASDAFLMSREVKMNLRVHKMLEEKFEPLEVLQKYYAGGICGYDKEGSPIKVAMYGALDMQGLMRSASKTDFERMTFLLMEQYHLLLKKQSIKLKKHIDAFLIIGDMAHIGHRNLWLPGLQMFMHLNQIMDTHYPGCIKKIILIRTPKIMPLLWKLGYHMIPAAMRERITLLRGNYSAALLNEIDADQLPKCYGGTLTDPDGNPKCVTRICQGGKVPSKYYLMDDNQLDHLEAVWIRPGRFLTIECRVRVMGSLLRWEFCTTSNDIGFGILYTEEDGTNEAVVPIRRFKCQHCVEDGNYTCQKLGTYTVVFDNSYSFSRWRHLHYHVDLIASDQETTKAMHKHELRYLFDSVSRCCTQSMHSAHGSLCGHSSQCISNPHCSHSTRYTHSSHQSARLSLTGSLPTTFKEKSSAELRLPVDFK